MSDLRALADKVEEMEAAVREFGQCMANGFNVLSDRIESMKECVAQKDYAYSRFGALFNEDPRRIFPDVDLTELEREFGEMEKRLPETLELLGYDVIGNLAALVAREDFLESWNALPAQAKRGLVSFDKRAYGILREKVDVVDFGFMFEGARDHGSEMPELLAKWIKAPADSKLAFYKLKKEAQGGPIEEFFNLPAASDSALSGEESRKSVAVEYLVRLGREEKFDWYGSEESFANGHWAFVYVFNFLSGLEDELNGYAQVKKNAQLPDLLKKWCARVDMEQFEAEMKEYQKEAKGTDHSKIVDKYPAIKLSQSLQRGLKKEEFLQMREESKGTELEGFFGSEMAQKMAGDMPYRRQDYMFHVLRNMFMKGASRKMKP